MSQDQRVDIYIEKAEPFAQPILRHLRSLVHNTCPDAAETIKWGFPHFDYKGEMMCSMAAFKQHSVFGFWKAALMKDPSLLDTAKSEVAMGHLGRITSLRDLPSDKKLIAYIKEAMKLNEQGIKIRKEKKAAPEAPAVPDDFNGLLKKNQKAAKQFRSFSPSAQREYITWFDETKTLLTREKRMMQAIDWIAEGKRRNWKYER